MICLISGTNRENSNSLKIARILEGEYRDLGSDVLLLDLRDLPRDLFSPEAYQQVPESFLKGFIEPVLNSEGLHIVTPEYNGSFPGVLKYFIDMLPFPQSFESRPVAFTGISAGGAGALRPVEQLQMVFGYRNAYLFPRRVFIPAVGNLLDREGGISDPSLADRLHRQCAEFISFKNHFQPVGKVLS